MQSSRSTFQRIIASWMSMKTWVKNWLFFLNGVFIVSIPFLGRDPAFTWILVAYVASGPLLAWLMIRERGLSLLLGGAHLIPWLPLLAYLLLRLGSNVAGPQITVGATPAFAMYIYLLVGCLIFCLALDARDVMRFVKGERYVLGSREAVNAGASKPTPQRLPCESAA